MNALLYRHDSGAHYAECPVCPWTGDDHRLYYFALTDAARHNLARHGMGALEPPAMEPPAPLEAEPPVTPRPRSAG